VTEKKPNLKDLNQPGAGSGDGIADIPTLQARQSMASLDTDLGATPSPGDDTRTHLDQPDLDLETVADIERRRLLLVEPSSTMRYVLEKYLIALGYDVTALDDYSQARTMLRKQFDNFDPDHEFLSVLFGWQATRDSDAGRFLVLLDSPDFHDLPVVVLSQEMRADSRAWVAGRARTTQLRWKDYREIKDRLITLLDDSFADEDLSTTVKFSNDDINILVVDDSASIRFALRDLLALHGYRVTITATHEEAMQAAINQHFDVSVLDFYLEESTGDDLCRALIEHEATGEITCAILTGTYSDHIIKRSLRSGAVECMFKNESSELLLARIDAISRIVRSRKILFENQTRLDQVIDKVGAAVLVSDANQRFVFVSGRACTLLGFDGEDAQQELLGQRAGDIFGDNLLESLQKSNLAQGAHGVSEPTDSVRLEMNGRDGSAVDVAVSAVALAGVLKGSALSPLKGSSNIADRLDESGDILWMIKPYEAPEDPQVSGLSCSGRKAGLSTDSALLSDSDSASLFVDTLEESLRNNDESSDKAQQSVLLLELACEDVSSNLLPITSDVAALAALNRALRDTFGLQCDVAYFGSSRLAFLFAHNNHAQSLMLARRIMQVCNQLGDSVGYTGTSCIATLTGLGTHAGTQAENLLTDLHRKLSKMHSHTRNIALLADYDRYLSAYPDA